LEAIKHRCYRPSAAEATRADVSIDFLLRQSTTFQLKKKQGWRVGRERESPINNGDPERGNWETFLEGKNLEHSDVRIETATLETILELMASSRTRYPIESSHRRPGFVFIEKAAFLLPSVLERLFPTIDCLMEGNRLAVFHFLSVCGKRGIIFS